MIFPLQAILAPMFLVAVLFTIGITVSTVREYGIGSYLAVAAIAAFFLVFASKMGSKLLAGAAAAVGAGALIIAVGTVINGENRKQDVAESRVFHPQVRNLMNVAGQEMGSRYPLKTFGQSSPDYVEFTDRVDAKIRDSGLFRGAGGGKVMKDLCRVVLTHELGLRDPGFAQADLVWSAPFDPSDPRAFISSNWLEAFANLKTPPRHPETVARCASVYGFRVPA